MDQPLQAGSAARAAPPPGRRAVTASFHHHEAELDLGAHMQGMTVRRVAGIIAVAVPVAAAFASEPLYRWVFNLPLWLGPVRQALVAAARWWNEAMAALGPADVYLWLQEAFRWFQHLV